MAKSHLRFLRECFLPEARFPDEKFWNKDGSPIQAPPKKPPPGTKGLTHADIGAKDQDDRRPSSMKKVVYFHDPKPPPEVPFEVAGEDDPRDPWNGGFPGAINDLEDRTGIDAHEVGFWIDTDGSLNCDTEDGQTFRWDEKAKAWS